LFYSQFLGLFLYSGTYGKADVILDAELHSQVRSYIAHYRPKTDDVDNVFVTWSGKKLYSIAEVLTPEMTSAGCTKRYCLVL
jgi:hypothetical protein